MYGKMKEFLAKELADIKAAGLYKNERVITTPQRADIKVKETKIWTNLILTAQHTVHTITCR